MLTSKSTMASTHAITLRQFVSPIAGELHSRTLIQFFFTSNQKPNLELRSTTVAPRRLQRLQRQRWFQQQIVASSCHTLVTSSDIANDSRGAMELLHESCCPFRRPSGKRHRDTVAWSVKFVVVLYTARKQEYSRLTCSSRDR